MRTATHFERNRGATTRGFARRSRLRATRTPPSRARSDPPAMGNPPGTTRDSTGTGTTSFRGSRFPSGSGNGTSLARERPRRSRRGRRAKVTRGRDRLAAHGEAVSAETTRTAPVRGEEVTTTRGDDSRFNPDPSDSLSASDALSSPSFSSSSSDSSSSVSSSSVSSSSVSSSPLFTPLSSSSGGHAGELDLLLENPAVLVHHRVVGRQEGDCDEGGREIVETGRWRGSARTGWTIRRAGPRRARGDEKDERARGARLSHTASADSYCAARTMSISSRFMSTTSRAESVATAGAAPGRARRRHRPAAPERDREDGDVR